MNHQAWACDTHVHVFDPLQFPYAPARHYTPAVATCETLKAYLDRAGFERVVLVQPSVYGSDHRCMLDAIKRLGSCARGIAVLAASTTDAQIEEMDAAGIVGARINLTVGSRYDPSSARHALLELDQRIPPTWHIQLHGQLDMLLSMETAIKQSGRPIVVDHFGLPDISRGKQDADWLRFLDLIRDSNLYVKLSGPYLVSQVKAPYSDLRGHLQTLALVDAKRLLWGSNWPHTQGLRRNAHADLSRIESFRSESDNAWKYQCAEWLEGLNGDVLAGNAHKLYFSV
jgi:predicted TIM-barrel fold metal-dependent hydrolase